MADDTHQRKPARRSAGRVPVLDLAFDSGTLNVLRAQVRAHACQAGMSEGRAEDVVLAVHELAANAVRHGAGRGRLRIWSRPEALTCQVDDGDPPAAGDPDVGSADGGAAGAGSLNSLQARPGHGLWVTRQVADRVQVLSGPDGTRATVTFDVSPGGLAPGRFENLAAGSCAGEGEDKRMYIGIGTIVLIVIIALVILLLRR